MNPRTHCQRTRISCQQHGLALLYWIAVLAVLAILLAWLLPTLIREVDVRVARDETVTLKTLSGALQRAIQRHGYIPAETNWAETVATEAGLSLTAVATNPRRQPRLLLIDTNGWFNQITLPYTQTPAGNTNRPLNVRLIIASSLGRALPLNAGRPSANEFNALWQAAEGTTNFPTTGLWSGWGGRSEDVKLERVNLSPLFVSLLVETYIKEPARGQFSIGTNTTLYLAPYHSDSAPIPPSYYLQNTVLRLFSDAGYLDSTQVLTRKAAYLYQNGVWRSSAEGGSMPGGVDIAGVVHSFLNAVPNTRARYGAAQQKLVVQAMMHYMSNYVVWADGNFANASLKTYLLDTAQPNMIGTLQDLFQGSYYPTNASGPQ